MSHLTKCSAINPINLNGTWWKLSHLTHTHVCINQKSQRLIFKFEGGKKPQICQIKTALFYILSQLKVD